jgi:hypothetical protein
LRNGRNATKTRIGTVPAKYPASQQYRQETQEIQIMRKDIEIGNYANGQDSSLWLAVVLSFTMIFTSYAVSVLNHRNGSEISAHTQPNRPTVVSYLA